MFVLADKNEFLDIIMQLYGESPEKVENIEGVCVGNVVILYISRTLRMTAVHEFIHIRTNAIIKNKQFVPVWWMEATAVYISNYKRDLSLDYIKWAGYFEYLVLRYGKEKFTMFMNIALLKENVETGLLNAYKLDEETLKKDFLLWKKYLIINTILSIFLIIGFFYLLKKKRKIKTKKLILNIIISFIIIIYLNSTQYTDIKKNLIYIVIILILSVLLEMVIYNILKRKILLKELYSKEDEFDFNKIKTRDFIFLIEDVFNAWNKCNIIKKKEKKEKILQHLFYEWLKKEKSLIRWKDELNVIKEYNDKQKKNNNIWNSMFFIVDLINIDGLIYEKGLNKIEEDSVLMNLLIKHIIEKVIEEELYIEFVQVFNKFREEGQTKILRYIEKIHSVKLLIVLYFNKCITKEQGFKFFIRVFEHGFFDNVYSEMRIFLKQLLNGKQISEKDVEEFSEWIKSLYKYY